MLAYVGMRLGEQWDKDPRLKMWFHRMDGVILAVLVAGRGVFRVVAREGTGEGADPADGLRGTSYAIPQPHDRWCGSEHHRQSEAVPPRKSYAALPISVASGDLQ